MIKLNINFSFCRSVTVSSVVGHWVDVVSIVVPPGSTVPPIRRTLRLDRPR